MAKVTIKIPWRYRLWIFVFFATSWVTGILFFCFNRWVTVEGDFGPEKHPWQNWFLKVHGGSAFMMMILYGFMLASHVPSGWKSRRQRFVGLSLVGAQGVLIVSAYFLYYSGHPEFRELIGYAHSFVGATLPLLLALHITTGRRKKGARIDTKIEKLPDA